MYTNGGSGNQEAGLHISVEGADNGATATFRDVMAAYDASAEAARRANDTAATSAETAGQRIAQAYNGQAVSMQEVENLRQRFNAGLNDSASAVDKETESRRRYVDEVNREITALRDLQRQGQITSEQRLQSTRDLALQIPQSRGDELLSRSDIRTSALAPGADQDAITRYRALIAVDKEVEVAQRELTATMVSSAKEQADAIRNGVRLGQVSREEEAEQLRVLLREYESYAEARMTIERRITENTIAQQSEQVRAQRERQGGVGDFALNAGYLLPGSVGNALTNIGYFAQDGPAALALGVGAVAGIGLISGLTDTVKVAAQAEDAMKRLTLAVKDQGDNYLTVREDVNKFVEAQEQFTIYGRDQTVPAITTLVDAGIKYKTALEIVRVAEDAAAATGKPLQTVVEGLQHAYEGNGKALVQLGLISRTDARDGAVQFGDALVLLEKRYRDQANAVDDVTDQSKLLGNEFDDLKKKIGDIVTPSALTFLKDLNYSLSDEGNAGNRNFFDSVTKSIQNATKAFDDFLAVKDKAGTFQGPFDPITLRSPSGTPPAGAPGSQYAETINKYAELYGVDPRVATALFSQESSFNPNARNAKSGALGLGQLLPGTANDLGVTNPLDPDQNIGGSLKYLGEQIRAFGGDVKLALAAYNAGPQAVRNVGGNIGALPKETQDYVAAILGNAGPVAGGGPNAAPSDSALRAIAGAGQIGSPGSKELSDLKDTFLREQMDGVNGFRENYENALKAIADDQSKDDKERNAAFATYSELVKQDAAAQKRSASELAKSEEDAYRLRLEHILGLRAAGKESNDQEIKALQALREQREIQGGPNEARDVQNLSDKIEKLQNTFASTLASLGKTYKDANETLDEYIAKVRQLERGANASQKTAGETAINSAIEAATVKAISDIKTTFDNAVKNGLSRPDQEAAARAALAGLGAIRNYGDTTAGDAVTNARAGYDQGLGTDYAADASAAVSALDRQYKELFTDISDGTATQVQKDQQQLALYSQQIAALAQLAVTYKTTYGTESVDAVKRLQDAIDELNEKQHDLSDQTARDERKALQERQQAYAEFTQSAEQHLLSLFSNGEKGLNGFRDVFRSVVKQVEADAAQSVLGGLFGGSGGSFSPLNSIETALLGGVAPAGYFENLLGGANKNSGSGNALMTQAYTKIAASSKGTVDDPHIVAFAPGIGGASGPGGFNSAAVGSYGLIGAIAGPAAAGIVSQIPTSGGLGSILAGDSFSSLAISAVTAGGGASSGSSSLLSGASIGGINPLSLLGASSSSYPYALSSGDAEGINPQTDPQLYGISPGAAGTSKYLSGALQGLGIGGTAASIDGGNAIGGSLGGALGGVLGTALHANPLISTGIDLVGGLIGSLFGNHTNAATSPDIYDTTRYGNDIASLLGKQAGANGTTFLPSAQLLGATNNLGEISYIEELLSKGQTAFIDSTGLTAQQYQTALGFFGSSSTGSGTLEHGKNIGQLSVSGATGAGATLSYTAAQQLAATILQGQQSGGSLGLPGTYTIARSNPDYNLGTVLPAIAATAASITGTSIGYGQQTGNSNTPTSATAGTVAQTNVGGYGTTSGFATPSGAVQVTITGNTFAGTGGVSDLADMIQTILQRKANGTVPTRYGNGYRYRVASV